MCIDLKRFLLFTSLCLFTWLATPYGVSISHAQNVSNIPNEMVQGFHQQCIFSRDNRISETTQNIFCKCAAHNLQQNISMETLGSLNTESDMNTLLSNIQEIVLLVYAPCLEFPVREMVFLGCQSNDFQKEQGICGCVADKVASFTAEEAQTILVEHIAKQDNALDPLNSLSGAQAFVQREKKASLECIQEKQAGNATEPEVME